MKIINRIFIKQSGWKIAPYSLMILLILLSGACTMSKTKKGALIGTASGAAMGAVVGKASGNTVLGAIIGAAVGGTTGVLIGKKMDKQAEEIRNEVPDVKVERVGEGIIIEFNEKILFDFAKYELKSDSKNSLDKFINILKKYPETNIEIQGHTDSKGSTSYNKSLSTKRAQSTKNYLVMNNINSKRINLKGMGEKYPKVDNTSESNRAENRRVEFLITANEKMKQDAK